MWPCHVILCLCAFVSVMVMLLNTRLGYCSREITKYIWFYKHRGWLSIFLPMHLMTTEDQFYSLAEVGFPQIPLCFSSNISPLWYTQSNPFEISRNIEHTSMPESRFSHIMFVKGISWLMVPSIILKTRVLCSK